jgi:hypothetical protein
MRITDRFDDGIVEMVDVVGDEVRQGGVFGVAPQRLDGVQVGSVGRQPFDRKPVRTTCPQTLDRRAMHAPTIEHDEERFAMLTVQGIEVAHHVLGADVVDVEAKRQAHSSPARRDGQAADYAQAVVSLRNNLLRPRSGGCPGAPVQRLQNKAGFVEQDDSSLKASSLFLGLQRNLWVIFAE